MYMNTKKTIKDRLKKDCVCCGKDIKVIVYSKDDYRGGHYFGKTPFYRKNAKYKVVGKFHGTNWDVVDCLEKPLRYDEYWECPKCYWGGKNTKIPKNP